MKWKTVIDDMNPRKGRIKKKPEIRIYKPWTLVGQAVKAMEELTPTTAIKVFNYLVERHAVANSEKGLNVVRRTLTLLQKHRTIVVDLRVRKFVAQEYGTASLLILNPKKKYKMI